MKRQFLSAFTMAIVSSLGAAEPIPEDLLTVPGVSFESYLVRWWGSPGSKMTRPIYHIARFDTDVLQLHYGIVPGRELADYTMPYWPIRSFLSFVDAPAEIAQQVRLAYTGADGEHAMGFTPRSGVELAAHGGALAVKIRNRAIITPEDLTIPADKNLGETNPLSFEQTFVLRKGVRTVPIHCKLSNVGAASLRDVTITFTYEQSFGWNRYGAAEDDVYAPITGPASGAGHAFYAFSDSTSRGFAFIAGEGISLTYELMPETNEWRVNIAFATQGIPPESMREFHYVLQLLDAPPKDVRVPSPQETLPEKDFTRVQPTSFKTAPVDTERRVQIQALIADLDRPKVRGLNLRAGFPRAFEDINTLRDWGCNQIIASLGDPDQTAELIERGHALGMEMLLTGRGSFKDGPPQFDAYYAASRRPEQIPDAHGQDEDHYYWFAIQPRRTFETVIGKPISAATHEEKVTYWARSFADKWLDVKEAVRPYAPDAGVWFYAPFPGVAHVDPVDSYDLFMRTITDELGNALTVFPFYYGIEHNQTEYMVRRWKDAGAARAVFLPMRDFMTKPSQFIRSITAARRGGADGTCGFSFAVGDAPLEDQWQWKAVMLGAWVNFPTSDLDALCLVEEPAELVELLAEPQLIVRAISQADKLDGRRSLAPLFEGPFAAREATGSPHEDELTIVLTNDLPSSVPSAGANGSKGIVDMRGRTVHLCGADTRALQRACGLLLRFAEVARDERG